MQNKILKILVCLFFIILSWNNLSLSKDAIDSEVINDEAVEKTETLAKGDKAEKQDETEKAEKEDQTDITDSSGEEAEYSNYDNFSNMSQRTKGRSRSFPAHPKKIGAGKHPPALEQGDLPKDRFGLIDWAKAVREGKISPLPSLDMTEGYAEEYIETNMILQTAITFNDVLFPHDIHSYWLKCDTCHDQIFIKKRGANNITMMKNKSGLFCGRCHGKVAFPFEDCDRCHIIAKTNFPY